MRLNRYLLREQPVGTWIDDIDPWPLVIQDDSVVKQKMDQCMVGLRDDWNQPVKKPTEWTANSLLLVKPMKKLQCDGRHFHGQPTSKALEKLKTYPWELCEAVVDGIESLKQDERRNASHTRGNAPVLSYPTIGTSTDADDAAPPRAPFGGRGCPACHSGWRMDHPSHTRKPGVCRWHDIKARHWEYPACEKDGTGRNNPVHLPYRNDPTTCRFGIWPKDAGPPRSGAHPRDPRRPTVKHPSSDMRANDMGLGEVAPDVPDVLPHGEGDPTARSSTETDTKPEDSMPRGVRGPDTVNRTRRTFADAGSGPTKLPDWTQFNIQVSLRNLRSWNPRCYREGTPKAAPQVVAC